MEALSFSQRFKAPQHNNGKQVELLSMSRALVSEGSSVWGKSSSNLGVPLTHVRQNARMQLWGVCN